MSNIILTQIEADALIAMEKCRIDSQTWYYPSLGGQICIPLVSSSKRESFILDISKSGRIVLKGKYQNRARQSIILVRYDFGGSPHRNPDGSEIDCPHLHVYREGYGDRWAFSIPVPDFCDITNPWQVLQDFMKFCNITEPPDIQKDLFI